jgi:GNAT superfamily N-acetyltransferase
MAPSARVRQSPYGSFFTVGSRRPFPGSLGVQHFLSTKGLIVSDIHVAPEKRRKGYGTRLYEAAANYACDEGLRLMSADTRSHFSEAFWRKQRRKGRAVCFRWNSDRQDNFSNHQLLDLEEALAQKYRDRRGEPDYNRAQLKLRSIRKKLPKPRRARGAAYWPCWRWALKKRLCKQRPISLGGFR